MLKTLLGWVITLLILIVTAVTFLFTPLGFKVSLALAGKVLPGELNYQQVSGTLIGPLSIQGLNYQQTDLKLSIGQLDMTWNPLALLTKKLSIRNLSMTDVTLITEEQANKTSQTGSSLNNLLAQLSSNKTDESDISNPSIGFQGAGKKLTLPFRLNIRQAVVKELKWGHDPRDFVFHLKRAKLHAILTPDKIDIDLNARLLRPGITRTHLTIQGDLTQYQLIWTGLNPQGRWRIDGHGGQEGIEVKTGKARLLQGQVDARINLRWFPDLDWNINAQAKHLDLKLLHPNLPASLSFNLVSQAKLTQEKPRLSWDTQLSTGGGRLQVKGSYDGAWKTNWTINITDLQRWWSDLSGDIKGQGGLRGHWLQGSTFGKLQLDKFAWQGNTINKLKANWKLNSGNNQSDSSFSLSSQAFDAFRVKFDQLFFKITGDLDQHHLSMQAIRGDQGVKWQASGKVVPVQSSSDDYEWQGNLQQLLLQQSKAQRWVLEQAVPLTLSADKLSLGRLCLQANKGAQADHLCMQGSWTATQAWNFAINGKLHMEHLSPLFLSRVTWSGLLNLQGSFSGEDSKLQQADFKLNLKNGYLKQQEKYRKAVITEIANIFLTAKVDKQAANLQLKINLKDKSELNTTITLPQYLSYGLANKEQKVTGKLTINARDLGFFAVLFPEHVKVGGQVYGQFDLAGTWMNPDLIGSLVLKNGSVHLPQINLTLDKADIKITSKGRKLNYTVQAFSAGKPVNATGYTDYSPGNLATEFTVKGDNVLAVNTNEYQFFVSPDVRLLFADDELAITGKVDIPKALLQPIVLAGVVTLPEDDVIYTNTDPKEKPTTLPLKVDLDLTLGDKVVIKTGGLEGKLDGQVTILTSPGQSAIGVGRIGIRGNYSVSGSKLAIAPASAITFRRSPLDNPYLNIQALKTIRVTDADSQQIGLDDLKVGVNISGSAQSPQIRLFSNQASLSQADILSYLVLGTSSQSISPASIAVLTQALDSLKLGGGEDGGISSITSQIRQGLGFSELGVETDTTLNSLGLPLSEQQSFIVVGKRITPHLHVRYKVDPLTATNVFQAEYELSRRWRAQVDAGTEGSGFDIFYSIDAGGAPTKKKHDKNKAKNKKTTTTQTTAVTLPKPVQTRANSLEASQP